MSKPKVGIIIGTSRPTRIGLAMAQWLQTALQNDQVDFSLIDLAEVNLPFLDEPDMPSHGNYQQEHTKAWSKQIQGYDGFILLFPQYNWGYPAVLKNALDYLYVEWHDKPVSIASYGSHGGFQGALAIRLVTQGLHMKSMTSNLSIDIEDEMFGETGQFKNIEESLKPYANAAQLVSTEFSQILS